MKFDGVEWDSDYILDEFWVSEQTDLVLETIKPLVDLGILVGNCSAEAPDFYLDGSLVVSVEYDDKVFVRRDFIDEIS